MPKTALAIAAALIGLTALATAPRADAAVTCTYDGAPFNVVTIRLGAHGDSADVEVAGAEIQVRDGTTPCPGASGPPTVHNTDAIVINDVSDNLATTPAADGNTSVQIMRPNAFAPGATQEHGSPAFSEIEIRVNSGPGFDFVDLQADPVRADSDAIALGAVGINWNATAADPAVDSDVSHTEVERLSFVGGPGNDIINAQGGVGVGNAFDGPALLSMRGEGGTDVLTGGRGADNLQGANGDDTLHGDAGNDLLEGDDGDDRLHGEDGDDRLIGGAGDDGTFGGDGANDVVDFEGGPAVTADLSRTGPQQTGSGFDTLTGMENLVGSEESDSLIGDAGVNFLSGGGGSDTLDGGPGGDLLDGGSGSGDVDTVTYARAPAGVTANLITGAFGGGGSDDLANFESLVGSPFADDLTGTAEGNVITGLAGTDTISALGGPDTVNARDGGPDTLSCGSEIDTALADRRSVEGSIAADCETVDFLAETAPADIPPGGVPPGGATTPDTAISVVLRGARSQRMLKQKGVIIKVRCPLESCTARASGTGKLPRLGPARPPRKLTLTPLTRSIPGGATRTLKLRLAKRQQRALKAALAAGKRPKLSVTVRATDAAGNATIRNLTVRARR